MRSAGGVAFDRDGAVVSAASSFVRLFPVPPGDHDAAEVDNDDDGMYLRPPPPPAPSSSSWRVVPAPLNGKTSRTKEPRESSALAPTASSRARMYSAQQSRQHQPGDRGGWNGSTQLDRGSHRPLQHQILCRTYEPPPPRTLVGPSATGPLIERLSKGTISSRLKKGAAATASTRNHDPGIGMALDAIGDAPAVAVEVDRKRHHLQQRQTATIPTRTSPVDHHQPQHQQDTPQTRGRDAIQMLLFYRREVEKRLRADPIYCLQQPRS